MYGNEFPLGRGAYISFDRSLIVWLNEAEHLKLMFRKDGAEDFGQTYRSFVRAVGKLDEEKRFVRDNRLGFITFDVASLGTGLRVSARCILKKTDPAELAAACDKLDLEVERVKDELGRIV